MKKKSLKAFGVIRVQIEKNISLFLQLAMENPHLMLSIYFINIEIHIIYKKVIESLRLS